MRDAFLIVDVLQDFGHDDGEALLASFRERHDDIAAALASARDSATPIVYANDNAGLWDSDLRGLVERALEGPGCEVVAGLLPRPGERFVVKPRYSAFDHTPLALILEELECERLLVAGATTEGCVAQTGSPPASSGTRSRSSRPPARQSTLASRRSRSAISSTSSASTLSMPTMSVGRRPRPRRASA